MLNQIRLENLLLLDVETATEKPNYEALSAEWQACWNRKAQYFREDWTPAEAYQQKASLYSEFSKVVCISVAYVRKGADGRFTLRVKSFSGNDEKQILEDFANLIGNYYNHRRHLFSGHNVREFDLPFVSRRMVTNRVKLPFKLNQSGPKSFPIAAVDTMQIWKFGEHKNYTSLKLLKNVLGIEYPEQLGDGSMVNKMYWEEENIEGIVELCEKDVITVGQVLMHFKGFDLFVADDIEFSKSSQDTAPEETYYEQESPSDDVSEEGISDEDDSEKPLFNDDDDDDIDESYTSM